MTFRRRSILPCAAVLIFASGVPARALAPYRVADVDTTYRSAGSSPNQFVRVGSRALFVTRSPVIGLWASDGTAAGTVRLFGSTSAIDFVAATGELLFFQSCGQGCRLRVTDGTVAGTRLLASGERIFDGTVAGPRRIYFTRQTVANGSEPWTSDGTPAGTRLVKDLSPGPGSLVPTHLFWSNKRLWFFASGGLWMSNGTAAGTRRIATVGTGEIRAIGATGSRLVWFGAATPSAESRLWGSDGTAAGTRTLGVVLPVTHSIEPFATAGTNIYFTQVKDEGQVYKREIWATDGTPARTRKIASFDLLNNSSLPLVAVGPRVAFIVWDTDHGRELWSSDGTAAGTRVIDVCPGTCSGADQLGAAEGGRLWFTGRTPDEGAELWISDLSAAGTRLVKDLVPGPSPSDPELFLAGGGKLFFSARPGSEELWSSDGTAAGTRLIVRQANEDSRWELVLGAIVGGRAFLALNDDVHGTEPWVTDGTPAATRLVADIDPSQVSGSFPQFLRTGVGGRCFFLANLQRPDRFPELWSSDGTAVGTVLAHRFDDSDISSPLFFGTADLGSRIAIIVSTSFGVAEIWISDGSEVGTLRLDSVEFRPTGRFRAIGGRLFFEAFNSAHATELWTTDGTAAGTVRLSDFENDFPFPDDHPPQGVFRALGNRLAFLAADSFGRLEPWVSDGTIGGTRRLAEVYPALVASFFELSSEIVETGGKVFYVSGEESEVGTEPALWVSDLTAGGTRKVHALVDSRGERADHNGLYVVGGRVVLFYRGGFEGGFWSTDGSDFTLGAVGAGIVFGSTGSRTPVLWGNRLVYPSGGLLLYATDGTAAGTMPLLDSTGQELSTPYAFTVLGSRLAYVNIDGIWDTDGTPAGTVRRLKPRANLTIDEFQRAGDRIFFPWYDAATGTELWALRP